MRVRICIVYLSYSKLTRKYLHLLRRWLAAESSTKGVGLERSSKLMMYRQMSSTSLLTGAITSLHRNFVPETWLTGYYYIRSINQINVYKLICMSKVVGAHDWSLSFTLGLSGNKTLLHHSVYICLDIVLTKWLIISLNTCVGY